MTVALEASGLSVSIGRDRIVADVSLAVEHGEWVAVIGPNGAGKTTLLRALCGLRPFDGQVVAAAYVLGRSAGGVHGTTTLILAGVIVALFMTAIHTFLQQYRSDTLREVYAWLLGGFGTADWRSVATVTPYIAIS